MLCQMNAYISSICCYDGSICVVTVIMLSSLAMPYFSQASLTLINKNPVSPFMMMDMKGSTSEVKEIHYLHKEWDDVSCPICMDHPHNAVLIICSSHEKGCRSYICDTSYRHSNCLDRFKKLEASHSDNMPSQSSSSMHNDTTMRRNLVETGLIGTHEGNNDIQEGQGGPRTVLDSSDVNASESNCLKCPLCRGNVLDIQIVKEARQYLDLKLRSCAHESCSFSGNYRELRRHARRVHPMTRPGDVDPSRQRAWRRLEHQSEYGDVLSALRSEMPGALVLGDYVIDSGDAIPRDHDINLNGEGSGQLWTTTFFLFQMIDHPLGSHDEPRSSSSRAWRTHRRSAGSHRHRHRNLWGENLLGLRHNADDGYLDDDRPLPRRRRRFMRSRPDEEHP